MQAWACWGAFSYSEEHDVLRLETPVSMTDDIHEAVYDHPRGKRGRLLRHAFHDVGSDECGHCRNAGGIIRRMFSRKEDASQGCLVEIMMRTRHAAFGA